MIGKNNRAITPQTIAATENPVPVAATEGAPCVHVDDGAGCRTPHFGHISALASIWVPHAKQ